VEAGACPAHGLRTTLRSRPYASMPRLQHAAVVWNKESFISPELPPGRTTWRALDFEWTLIRMLIL